MDGPMMNEAQFLDELRQSYRAQGYRDCAPSMPLRIPGIDSYQPDLVLEKDGEVILIEIKSDDSPRTAEQIQNLKAAIERQPNWHFRFMVMPKRPPAPADEDDLEHLAGRLELMRRFTDADPGLAAILLWTILEAAMRQVPTRHRQRPGFGTAGMAMARMLRDLGELDDEDLRLLEAGQRARNLAVHGYRIGAGCAVPAALYDLAETLVRRIDATDAVPAAAEDAPALHH